MKTFVALALLVSIPNPVSTFHSWFSPEVAKETANLAVNGEYREYLDYNGDGVINVFDTMRIMQRYANNVEFGNEITFDSDVANSIIEENFNNVIYWEIDFLNEEPCRMYEYAASEADRIHLYVEIDNGEEIVTDGVWIDINPIEETFCVE